MFEIIHSSELDDSQPDFVGLVYQLNGPHSHSLFFIGHDSEKYEFHYDGKKILLDKRSNEGYIIILDPEIISSDEVPAFYAMCRNVFTNAHPRYGYFYSGELYNKSGEHFSEIGLTQTMTCVGFCLNVLKGFLEKDYLDFKDWDDSNIPEGFLEYFCKKYDLDIKRVEPHLRRITPIELFTSGHFTSLPIKKKYIDIKKIEVEDVITKKENYRAKKVNNKSLKVDSQKD